MKILFFLSFVVLLLSSGILVNDMRKPSKAFTHTTATKLAYTATGSAFFTAVFGVLWAVS